MERKAVDWIAIIVIVAAVIFAGCTELKSDEKKVAELIQKDCEYANDGDWKSMYEQYSPGFRNAYPYNAFAEDMNKVMALVRVLGGKGKFTVENVNVRIKGDIAYATYAVKLDGDILMSYTEGEGISSSDMMVFGMVCQTMKRQRYSATMVGTKRTQQFYVKLR